MSFQIKTARPLIVSAFTNMDQFDLFLIEEFNINRQAEIEGSVLNTVVLNTITRAEAEGWLPQLIASVARARPMRQDIQAMYQDYAVNLIGEAKRREVQASLSIAYASFGLAPPVVLERGGVAGAAGSEVKANDAGLEKTLREDLGYFEVAVWRDKLYRLEGRVCRVELNDAAGTMGTGFLVGPSAVLTNYHVLEKVVREPQLAPQVRFRFDYKVLPGGRVADGVLVKLAGEWQLGSGPYSTAEKAGTPEAAPPRVGELDYVLARLERPVGNEPVSTDGPVRGWVEVPTAQPALAGMAALLILQHPSGAPLKLAFDTCPNMEVKHGGLRVRYATNTEGGSSGSPCFDKDWKLVALHHYGDPALNQPKYNQGIPIALIRERLSAAARAELGGPCD